MLKTIAARVNSERSDNLWGTRWRFARARARLRCRRQSVKVASQTDGGRRGATVRRLARQRRATKRQSRLTEPLGRCFYPKFRRRRPLPVDDLYYSKICPRRFRKVIHPSVRTSCRPVVQGYVDHTQRRT